MARFTLHDHYFAKAKAEGYMARSVYKLEEIDRSINVVKTDSIVLDLGCSPGSWLQYVAKKLGRDGRALGVDLKPVGTNLGPKIKTVVDDCFLLTDEKMEGYMTELITNFTAFDLILSDMAPKTSGIKHVDQARSFDLAQRVLSLAGRWLKPKGSLIIKIFASDDAAVLLRDMKKGFKTVKQMRPKGVRAASKEVYLVGLDNLSKRQE